MGAVEAGTDVWVESGVASRPFPGQRVSGDSAVLLPFPGGWLVGAIDGAGHGTEAAQASTVCLAALQADPAADLPRLFARCHEALRGTRGAVLTIAQIGADALRWAGIGNVAGVLLPAGGAQHRSLRLRSGVVGHQMPQVHVEVLPFPVGSTLLFLTDGVRRGVEDGLPAWLPPEQAAARALQVGALPQDDAMVVAVSRRGGV